MSRQKHWERRVGNGLKGSKPGLGRVIGKSHLNACKWHGSLDGVAAMRMYRNGPARAKFRGQNQRIWWLIKCGS